VGAVLFLDPETGAPVRPAIERDEPSIGVAWSPDGQLVAVVSANNLVHLHSVADGAEVGVPIENVDATITDVAFSPDGRRLAVGIATGAVRQYSVATHEPVGAPLEADPNGVFGVAYSPDGALLAGTSLGFSTTRLWDTATGRPIGTRLTGGRVPYGYRTFLVDHLIASRPAFSPDGASLVTPGFPGATVRWDLDPTHWRAAACAITGRDLTDEEWDRYLPGRTHHPVCGTG
jgi:WD40 repeat protein